MKRTPIRRISKRKIEQKKQEAKLTQELLKKSDGLCAICHNPADWRGFSKHEKVFRSHGGDPIDKGNCVLICAKCHSRLHGIVEH
jgi:5-methylcytosine-specific restriction endonuclease McrA